MKKSNRAYKTYLLRILAILSFLSSSFWIVPGQVHAAPAGFQEYYVLGNEEQIYNMFDHIDTMEGGSDMIYGNRMRSVVAIVATADNQVIYYDHWEDGYEANIFTPTQNSTEIYGDGNPGNGGAGPDILSVGSIISLKSDGSGSGVNAVVPVNPRGTALRYDGGDYLLSIGGPVDLVHALWPRSTTWIGGAWEVYSLQALAHSFSYHIPVGEGLAADFKYVWLQVEALYDDTTVTIDNGTESIVVNLNKGQTYSSRGRIDSRASTPITVNEGTTVSSDKQVQVGLVTGGPDEFQTRFFVIVPDLIWGTEYVVAIPRTTDGEETEIYLYNPNDHSITVETYDASGDDSIAIAAGEVAIYSQEVGYVPSGSAVRLNSDDVFWGLVSADTSNDDYDWGFSLIPTLFLMDEYYVSWAPGNLATTDNAAPVWVAPVADNTTFYVDYGPVDGQVDQTFTIDALDTRRIFDPDNDNTGMHIWATGKFVPIWGIDPASGRPGEGYLDLGYSILPLYQGWLDPVLSLEKTADPEALPAEGGTATFILQAKTYGPAPVTNVDMTDILPIGWTYVAGSTIVTYPDGSTDSPDPVQSGQNLFWNLSHEMGSNQTLSLQFDAQILTRGSVGSRHFDGFETNNYSGGSGGWLGGWIESEGNGSATGDIRIVGDADVDPYSGDRQLQIADDDQTIYREIDLSGFSQPVLRFKRYFRLLEGGETFGVDISVDNGSSYTPVLSWSYPAVVAGTWVQEEVDLSAYITDTARLRFHGLSGVSPQDYFHVDDVEVYDAVVVNENAGQVAGEYRGYVFNATDDAVVYISALDLEKTADRSVVGIGDTIEYTLSYRNNGTITMTGTYINDTIPWGATFSGASSGGSYNRATNTVSWTLGDVGPSETGSVTFTVTVDDRTPPGTVIENLGRINSDQAEQVSSNVVEITIMAPDLAVTKSDSPDPVAAGMTLTYTLVYTNNGPSDAQDVYITDTLPISATFGGVVSEAPPLPSFDQDGQHLTWYTPTLAAEASGTIVFTVTVNPDASDTITNNVVITNSTLDTNPDNNEDSEPTDIGIPTLATIYGAVFDDTNGNGVQDTGEVGIANVLVTLDGTITTTTRADGSYIFFTNVEGVHTVVETDPDGYFSTTPNEVHVDVSMGSSYRVDFGDAPDDSGFAAIYGTVFEDTDGDGVWDAEEVGIPNVTVTLDGLFTTTTDRYGGYTFSTAVEGVHTVVETDPDGYFSTTPNEVHVDVTQGRGYEVNFGDAPDDSGFAAIYGTVFEDSDGDGVWDAEEVGIPNVTVTLDGLFTTTTDRYGGYTFSTAVESVHTVVETDPDGYFSTTPNEVHVDVTQSHGYEVNFGDAPDGSGFAAIYGTVFEDADSDKAWDADEVGIAGVLITMNGGATATTGLYGGYTFSTTVEDVHTVVETDPDGYFSTTPNTVTLSVELGQGYQVDFGDVSMEACICPPDGYEVDDTWQQAVGLDVDVRQTHDFCDDATDWITFTVQAGDVYTITTSSWGQRADTFLALFDTDAVTLLAANDDYEGTTDYSSRIVWQAPADGVYYVHTTNRAGLTGCATDYDLLIESQAQPGPEQLFVYLPIVMRSYGGGGGASASDGNDVYPTGVISHTCPDDYETDDTWQQAQSVEADVVQVHSFDSNPQRYAADKDFVWFDVSAGRAITFTVTAITNTQTLLELYDDHGAALNLAGTTQLVWTPATPGRYYLSVSPLTTTFGCADAVGYNLLLTGMAEMAPEGVIYLPIIMRNYH